MNKVKILFEDLALSSNYTILEEASNGQELKELAIKKGLTYPSRDLAFFKCRYAMVDKQNRNKCTLPRKEVKKALKTLNGKAIDKDHLRQNTLGYWIDCELDEDEIVAYGAFWKSNFPEDYGIIQSKMASGKMKISFEAWGDREFNKDGSYNLTNIEFAGGALLFDTEPAFPEAEVLDFASLKEKQLEFAKVIEISGDRNLVKECSVCKKHLELKDKGQDTCPECIIKQVEQKAGKTSKMTDVVLKEDEEHPKEVYEDYEEEGKILIDEDGKEIVEAKKLSYKERQKIEDDMFAVVKEKEGKKVRMFPIHDPAHVRNALARLPQATETLKKLGISVETVKNKILKRAKELKMTDLLKRHNKEGGSTVDEILKKYSKASVEEFTKFIDEMISKSASDASKIAELTKATEDAKLKIENSNLELEKVKVEFAEIKKQLDERVAAEKAAIIKAKRDELGQEFAKDLSDEDILNDLKFENAKLKKELASVKATNTEPAKGGLDAGLLENEKASFEKQGKIHKQAFGQ